MNRQHTLNDLVRRLPIEAEFALVLALCFGFFIWQTLETLTVHSVGTHAVFSNRDALQLVEYELIFYPIALVLLALRGWRLNPLELSPTLLFTAVGVLLFALYDGLYWLALTVHTTVSGSAAVAQQIHSSVQVSPVMALLVAVINPIFKELIVVGYVVRRLEGIRGPGFAILASALLRTLYHLEQGALAVMTVFVLGLVFAWIFWRWRTLWPLVLAHGLTDYLSLHGP